MKNNAIKFGIIAGIITATFTVIGSILMATGTGDTGYKNSELIGYSGIFLAFSLIIVGMIKERQLKDGCISYKSAFMVGLKISAITTIFYVVAWMIMTAIYPQVLEGMFTMMEENIKSGELEPLEMQNQLDQMATWKGYYANPFLKPLMVAFEIFPIGLLISLIAAIFIQKKPRVAAETA
ncbi:MAG: DUF4199 domain-containing protein [Bacteroidetes bacterium]|jgi:hypothetical protein|nr:DUF4199 domain-containing protein [Bacteroidota bacterium]